MSGLAVPQTQPSGKTISRSGSSSSLRPSAIEHEDDLAPLSRSRRNSESNAAPGANAASAQTAGAPGSAASQAGLVPLPQGSMQASAENAALTSRVDWTEEDHLKATDANHGTTAIYVGKNKKSFHVHTAALTEKSPYFKKLLAEDSGHAGKAPSVEQTSFEDIDEFAMSLFMHWISDHGHLNGPHDFHSLAHYLGLYVLAKKFEIEGLENQGISLIYLHSSRHVRRFANSCAVMDLVRHYYAEQNMTAPAYRLEYVYTYTHGANHMRHFLVSTAAFRCLEETPHPDLAAANPMLHKTFYAPGSHVSDSIKAVLMKDPEMAIDFIEELVRLRRNGELDARHGADCEWHVHQHTPKCKTERHEPWQSDGPADEKVCFALHSSVFIPLS